MKRTVSRMGNSSLVMSLPSQWVKENNVKAGDEIEVDTNGSELNVSLTSITLPEKILERTVHNYSSRTVLNILNYAYRSGHTKIILHYKDQVQLNYIVQSVHTLLMGFEVIEQNKHTCTIQTIAEPSLEKVDVIIRKIFLLLKQFSAEIVQHISENASASSSITSIQQTKEMIDYFTNVARRSILSLQYGGKERSYFLWSVVGQLSLICHAYFYLQQNAPAKLAAGVRTSFSKVLQTSNQMLDDLYDNFYKENLDSLDHLDQQRTLVNQEIFHFMSNNQKISYIGCYLFEIIRQIQMASSFIFGWHLNNISH